MYFFAGHAAEGEVAAEVFYALRLQCLYLGDALFGRSDDGAMLGYMVEGEGRLAARSAPFFYAAACLARAVEGAAPLEQVYHPAQRVVCLVTGFLLGLGKVGVAEEGDVGGGDVAVGSWVLHDNESNAMTTNIAMPNDVNVGLENPLIR